jgi:hypothetical protein
LVAREQQFLIGFLEIIARQSRVRTVTPEPGARKLALYKPFKARAALLPPRVPAVRKRHDALSWAAGALAALMFSNSGSAWIISPSN